MGLAAPIISGVSAIAGFQQSRKADKEARKQNEQQNQLIKLQADQARELMPYGRSFLNRANTAFNPVMRFYLRAAGGDRGTLGRLMQPEVDQINTGFDTARRGIANVAPRSGQTAETNAQLPFARLGAIHRLFGGARMGALNALAGLGGQFAGLGSGLMSASLGGLQGAGASSGNLSQMMLAQRGQQMREGEAVGEGLAGALGGFNSWWQGRQGGK